MPRIRWVIDEDFLYAYRDYEFVQGVDGVPRIPGEHLGTPVAAFAIESHLDIQRDYNPVTGEEFNVIVENDVDRPWFERDFMRVDWSVNHLPGYYGQISSLYEILGLWEREPTDLFVQDQSAFPDSWRPQFHYMSCTSVDDEECDRADRDWASDYEQNELYSMSFVNQEIMTPGLVPDPFTGQLTNWCLSVYGDSPNCSAVAVYTRTGFLKVSDQRQYVPENWNDTRFDRHGYFPARAADLRSKQRCRRPVLRLDRLSELQHQPSQHLAGLDERRGRAASLCRASSPADRLVFDPGTPRPPRKAVDELGELVERDSDGHRPQPAGARAGRVSRGWTVRRPTPTGTAFVRPIPKTVRSSIRPAPAGTIRSKRRTRPPRRGRPPHTTATCACRTTRNPTIKTSRSPTASVTPTTTAGSALSSSVTNASNVLRHEHLPPRRGGGKRWVV